MPPQMRASIIHRNVHQGVGARRLRCIVASPSREDQPVGNVIPEPEDASTTSPILPEHRETVADGGPFVVPHFRHLPAATMFQPLAYNQAKPARMLVGAQTSSDDGTVRLIHVLREIGRSDLVA